MSSALQMVNWLILVAVEVILVALLWHVAGRLGLRAACTRLLQQWPNWRPLIWAFYSCVALVIGAVMYYGIMFVVAMCEGFP